MGKVFSLPGSLLKVFLKREPWNRAKDSWVSEVIDLSKRTVRMWRSDGEGRVMEKNIGWRRVEGVWKK